MDFEPLKNETPKQKQFRADMEEAGIELRTYSGRWMCGIETYGVSCGYTWDASDVHRATKVLLASESLGKGSILYVPL